MEKITSEQNLKACPVYRVTKAGSSVASVVVIEFIVVCPQHTESRHGDQEDAMGQKQTGSMLQGFTRFLHVFQDVQHQNGGVAMACIKPRIKRTDVDVISVGRFLGD